MSELVKAHQDEVQVEPKAFLNPLDISSRVDAAVDGLISSAVGCIEDELQRIARRRVVTAAVRSIYDLKKQLDGLSEMDYAIGVADTVIFSASVEAKELFSALNPGADAKVTKAAVEAFIGAYKKDKAKKS